MAVGFWLLFSLRSLFSSPFSTGPSTYPVAGSYFSARVLPESSFYVFLRSLSIYHQNWILYTDHGISITYLTFPYLLLTPETVSWGIYLTCAMARITSFTHGSTVSLYWPSPIQLLDQESRRKAVSGSMSF